MKIKIAKWMSPLLVSGLVACGGGGGGGSGGSQATSPAVQASAEAVAGQGESEAGEIVCNGANCRVPDSAGNAPVGSMYRFRNDTSQERELVVSGLSATFWHAAMTKVSGAGIPAGEFNFRRQSEADGSREPDYAAEHAELLAHHGPRAPETKRFRRSANHKIAVGTAYRLGDSHEWFDSSGNRDVSATLRVMKPLSGGGNVYVWSQEGGESTLRQADFLAERFVNSVYPIERTLLGAPWGAAHADFGVDRLIPDNTADVHIVVLRLHTPADQSLMGYVWSGNVWKETCTKSIKANCQKVERSNEALAVFLSEEVLTRSSPGQVWTEQGRGAAEALSTLAHEFAHLFYNYHKRYKNGWAAEVSVWENELAAQSIAYLVAADTFGGGRGNAPDAHPDLRKGGDFDRAISFVPCDFSLWGKGKSCYPKAVALGAMMIHQYGHQIFPAWVANQQTGARALADGLAAVGGVGYADVLERYSATMLWSGNGKLPARYGYPAKRMVLPGSPYFPTGKEIRLPQISLLEDKPFIPGDAGYEISKNFSYVRNGIWTLRVPANGWLTLMKG